MKDNVRLHLDLLETQLARVEGNADARPKFPKTAPLLERALKKGAAPSRDELRAQIAATRRDIVARKVHYAHTVLKRQLKQFGKVEPLRIARRAKTADEARRALLDNERRVLDAIDADAVCTEILNRAVERAFPDLGLVPGFERRPLPAAESNVYARFGKIDAVRAAIRQLADAIASVYPEAAAAPPDRPALPPKDDDFHAFAPEEAPTKAGAPSDGPDVEPPAGSDIGSGADSDSDADADPFFEQRVDVAASDDDSDGGLGATDEHGLPMLTQGYISGSDDDFDEPAAPVRPERKNRRGQRARRKIWEQKFGQRANHVLQQERERQRKQEEKERRQHSREQRAGAAKRRRAELDAKPLHPSWEAKRRQLDAQKEVKFQGTKKTFD